MYVCTEGSHAFLHPSPPLASVVPTHEPERQSHVQTLPTAPRAYGRAAALGA